MTFSPGNVETPDDNSTPLGLLLGLTIPTVLILAAIGYWVAYPRFMNWLDQRHAERAVGPRPANFEIEMQ